MIVAQAVTDPNFRYIVEIAIVVLFVIGGGTYAGKRQRSEDSAWQKIIQAYVVQVSGLRSELADERRRGDTLERDRDRLAADNDRLRTELARLEGLS